MIGIYKITNLENGKVYIGQSIRIEKRWIDHRKTLRNNIHRNAYLQHAWNKYGEDKFIHEIIEECSVDDLNDKEIYWINHYNSTNPLYGYNLDAGGTCNKEISDITRKRISIANRGVNNSQAHKVICLETKEVFDTIEEADRKYNIPKGSISSCCRKERKVAKGLHWMYYEDYINSTIEEINKLLKSLPTGNKAKVVNLTTNKLYNSIKEASKGTGNHRDRISKCCRGIISHTKGQHWAYLDELTDEYIRIHNIDVINIINE